VTADLWWPGATLALAVVLDLLVADPPNRWHPVAWMGRSLGWAHGYLEGGSPAVLFLKGAALIGGAAFVWGGVGLALSAAARGAGWPGVILEILALKMVISLRGLLVACRSVASALGAGDLALARRLAGRHLVSRATGCLDEAQVASATIESAAENLTDAFVAPLCFYAAFGLAGAWLYRLVNTADAMLGYRAGALEFFGKASARLDDFLNLLPSRMAAGAIVAASCLGHGNTRVAWRTMLRDRGRTASPNAGWTMAAMAGALGVQLEKVGAYRLGSGGRPHAADIGRGLRIVTGAALITASALVGLGVLRNYWG
jgi:adenosylcobinamide-phosphate synthase